MKGRELWGQTGILRTFGSVFILALRELKIAECVMHDDSVHNSNAALDTDRRVVGRPRTHPIEKPFWSSPLALRLHIDGPGWGWLAIVTIGATRKTAAPIEAKPDSAIR